jgi:DmsE family decaheme c-type cytochrome
MNKNRRLLLAPLVWIGIAFSFQAFAQAPATPAERALPDPNDPTAYTEKGADTCIKCHDEESEFPVFNIFKTKHAARGDARSPFAKLQCEACHGPGGVGAAAMAEALEKGGHVGKVRPGQPRPPILNFGAKSNDPVETQNGMCLKCHQKQDRIGWHTSAHEAANLSCANCHTIHAPRDPILTSAGQPEKCFACHLKQRADFHKPSVHPVRFGVMPCSECHSAHASTAESLLNKPTLNQTCYQCHADKRGPFLWEHAPVAEDCTLCHTPHGSINPALLTKRAPLLCQQCHSQAGHPSVAYTGAGLPGGSPSGFLLAGGCINCHSQVHGSNHPSGAKLMR